MQRIVKQGNPISGDETHRPCPKLPTRVSQLSLWNDDKWIFDERTPGFCPSNRTLSWSAVLPGGHSRLTDRANVDLLQYFRALVWVMLTEPDNASPLATTRLNNLGGAIRMLALFMIETGRVDVSVLDRNAVKEYLKWLPGNLKLGAENTTRSGLAIYLDILSNIYKQSDRLSDHGFTTMPEPPFRHSLVKKRVAQSMAGKEDGQIPTLPDDLAIPMMNAAYKWLGTRADDVIRMVNILYSVEANNSKERKYRTGKALVHEKFSAEGSSPWHAPLFQLREGSSTEVKANGGLDELRRLFDLVVTSCALVIQFSSGMRNSELCGIEAKLTSDGSIDCVIERQSQEGRYDLFLVSSVLSKTEAIPELHEWVVGLRPSGSDIEIPAVRAIQIAGALFKNWQEISDSKRLFSQAARGFPFSPASITGLTNAGYNLRLKKFLEAENIKNEINQFDTMGALGLTSNRGNRITSHMIRKLYANFAYITDPRLVEALRVQYGHSSLAMTYQYTHNPKQLDAADEVERALTLRRMKELIHGEPVAGRAASALAIDDEFQQLKAATKDGGQKIWIETEKWIQKHDLRFHECSHGGCLNVAPSEMRCKELNDTPEYLDDHEPDLSNRSAGTCIGCKNFIMMRSHREFWIERYQVGKQFMESALAQGSKPESLRIIQDRTKQAESLLRSIGVKLPFGDPISNLGQKQN